MKRVDLYISKDQNYFQKQEQDRFIVKPSKEIVSDAYQLHVDAKKQYQTIIGCGASFTDASAYLVNQVINDQDKEQFMKQLFDENEGIGLSFIRNPMGSSDFARDFYSYDDVEKGLDDFHLEHFSIKHDEADVIPLTKWAQKLNPRVKLMATPWSPPGWMKTSRSMIGGTLRYACYDVYAKYFTRFIQDYQKHGLHMDYISVQNEPDFSPGHYAGMKMTPVEQAHFIKYHLYPTFQKEKIDTKILCYDHNWDYYEYPEAVLTLANKEVDGVAWHVYGGNVSAQTKVHDQFPDKEVHFSESSGGEWVRNPLSSMIATGINVFRNYSKSCVLWNIALDEINGPFVPGFGKSTCHGLVSIIQETKKVVFNRPDYFVLAHFSKVARPGAVRIDSSYDDKIQSVAFKNEDDSIAIVFSNNTEKSQLVQIPIDQEMIEINVDANSHVSLRIY